MSELKVNMTIVNNDSFKDVNGTPHNVMMITFAPVNSALSGSEKIECEFSIVPRDNEIFIPAVEYLLDGITPQFGTIAYNTQTNTYYKTWNAFMDLFSSVFRIKYKDTIYSYTLTADNFQTDFGIALAFGHITLTFTSEI